jgi:hypothetical protein
MQERRARTRRLIELGGLVAKSRLPELLEPLEPDLHATLLGALLELADTLAHRTQARARAARWRDRGRQALRDV